MIDHDQIIQEVAKRHKVLLGKDDPILVTVTLMELVVNAYGERLENSVRVLEHRMDEISDRYADHSRELAESIVGTAVNEVTESMRTAREELEEDLKRIFNASRESMLTDIRRSRFAATVSVLAAAFSILVFTALMFLAM